MPRYVDHDARRRHIAATAAELVGTRGLEALTFRNVAEAAGSSTTVLTHYFTDKRDLLRSTFEAVAERSGARFDEAQRHGGGGSRECLEALLPLDARAPDRMALAHVLLGHGRERSEPSARGSTPRALGAGPDRVAAAGGSYPETADAEVEVEARRLVTLVHGLEPTARSIRTTGPPAEQCRILAHELGSLGHLDVRDGGEAARTSSDRLLSSGRRPPRRGSRSGPGPLVTPRPRGCARTYWPPSSKAPTPWPAAAGALFSA